MPNPIDTRREATAETTNLLPTSAPGEFLDGARFGKTDKGPSPERVLLNKEGSCDDAFCELLAQLREMYMSTRSELDLLKHTLNKHGNVSLGAATAESCEPLASVGDPMSTNLSQNTNWNEVGVGSKSTMVVSFSNHSSFEDLDEVDELPSTLAQSRQTSPSATRMTCLSLDSDMAAKMTAQKSESAKKTVRRAQLKLADLDEGIVSTAASVFLGDTGGLCGTLQYGQWRLLRLVSHPRFELVFAGIILLNAVAIAVESQYDGMQIGYDLKHAGSIRPAAEAWPHCRAILDVSDWCFGIVFIVEVVMKLFGKGLHFFKSGWNWLDLFIAVMFVFDKLALDFIKINPNTIRLLRLMKLLRMIRLVKTLEGFDALFLMVTALQGSVSILFWAFVLLFLILLTIAVLVNQILSVQYFTDESIPAEKRLPVYLYFGTCARSVFSMFEITMANWPPVSRLLAENVSEYFMLFCLLHKLLIGFAVIGVINGVFIQETFKCASKDDSLVERAKKKAAQEHEKRMAVLLAIMDPDADGRVDFEEFVMVLTDPDLKPWLSSMELSAEDLSTLFYFMDSDETGSLSCRDLCEGVARTKGAARMIDVMKVLHQMRKATEPQPSRRTMTMSAAPTLGFSN